jgi:hypothetical protein
MNVLLEKFSHLEAMAFGPKALRACQEAFVERHLARNEANRRVRLIRQCFRWAVSEEMIPPSVLQGLDALVGLKKNRTKAPDRAPIRPIADAIVQATLPHLPRAVRAMVEIQRLTGMRPTEAAIMRTVDLNTTGAIWEYRPAAHKLDHLDVERIVMIGPRAQEILKPWLRTDIEAHLFSPAETLEEFHAERRERRKTPMTPSQKSRKRRRKSRAPRDDYDVTSYRRSIHRACDDAFPHPELSGIRKKDLTEEQGPNSRNGRRHIGGRRIDCATPRPLWSVARWGSMWRGLVLDTRMLIRRPFMPSGTKSWRGSRWRGWGEPTGCA